MVTKEVLEEIKATHKSWLDEAKERAKYEAEGFIYDMRKLADEMNIESNWFIEEVIKNIHKEQKKINERE